MKKGFAHIELLVVLTVLVILAGGVWVWRNQQTSYTPEKEFESLQEALKQPDLTYKLNLSKQNLALLPKEITKLHNLEYLDLTGNQLASLPDEFWRLKKLEVLILDFNNFTELPDLIGKLSNLTKLRIYNNKLLQLTPEIGRLTNLKTLNLEGNEIRQLPSSLGGLKKLEELYLSSNKLINLPSEIKGLENLKYLTLSWNQLTDFPIEVTNLSTLVTLVLSGNKIAYVSQSIDNFINLETLGLDNNNLFELPPEIGNLTNLKSLSLDSNRLFNLPPEMQALKKLEYLMLSYNPLNQNEIDKIKQLLPHTNISSTVYTLPPVIEGKKLIDQFNGFSVEIPEGWQHPQELGAVFTYPLSEEEQQLLTRKIYQAVISIGISNEGVGTRYRDFTNPSSEILNTQAVFVKWLKMPASKGENQRLFKVGVTKLGGQDAIQFIYRTLPGDGTHYFYSLVTWVFRNDKNYYIELGNEELVNNPKIKASYQSVLSTFKFLD